MAFEQRELTGSLFKNDKRESDNHPHATGSALIDGVEYWVSAWTKEGAKGKWQSLAFKRKEAKPNIAPHGGSVAGMDDDIPFN